MKILKQQHSLGGPFDFHHSHVLGGGVNEIGLKSTEGEERSRVSSDGRLTPHSTVLLHACSELRGHKPKEP